MAILVVANQTLGGPDLHAAILQRINDGREQFHVVVPVTKPGLEADRRVVWNPSFTVPERGSRDEAMTEARQRAAHRLERMVAAIQSLGGQASGEVGTSDALNSVQYCLLNATYDEIIVSTLPHGISRWLKVDLPTRVANATDIPVTTVVASD